MTIILYSLSAAKNGHQEICEYLLLLSQGEDDYDDAFVGAMKGKAYDIAEYILSLAPKRPSPPANLSEEGQEFIHDHFAKEEPKSDYPVSKFNLPWNQSLWLLFVNIVLLPQTCYSAQAAKQRATVAGNVRRRIGTSIKSCVRWSEPKGLAVRLQPLDPTRKSFSPIKSL